MEATGSEREDLMPYWSRERGEAWRARNGPIMGRKYFCLGLGKTGTTTFAECARRLGYRHFGSGLVEIFEAGDEEALAQVLRDHDTFDDYPFPLVYEWLDAICDDPRYSLTLRRSPEVWLSSLKKHYDITGPTRAKKVHFGYYSPYQNEAHHLACYEAHNERVRTDLSMREGYREFVWEERAEWADVAEFLERDAPQASFPVANARSQSPEVLAVRKRLSDGVLCGLEHSRSMEAIALSRVLADEPEHAAAWFRFAQLLRNVGLVQLSVSYFAKAVTLEEGNKRYRRAHRAAREAAATVSDPMPDETFTAAVSDHLDGSREGVGIILLLNADFLPGLMALLASLIRTNTLRGASLVVMTDDPAVTNFPLLHAVAKEIILFGQAEFRRFAKVSAENVLRGERGQGIAKYTLLKFNFFRDFGFQSQIFLDCDMVVAKSLDGLLDEGSDNVFFAAPELIHDRTMRQQVRASIEAGPQQGFESINSGFMLTRQDLIRSSPDMVHDLIEIAQQDGFRKEQAVVSQLLKDREDVVALPCVYNFLRSYSNRIDEETFVGLKDDIVIAHYVNRKPWDREMADMQPFDDFFLELIKWAEDEYGEGWLLPFARTFCRHIE